MNRWPNYGSSGRAVKESCERIFATFSGSEAIGTFREVLLRFDRVAAELRKISQNEFFLGEIASQSQRNGKIRESFEAHVLRLLTEIEAFVAEQLPLWPAPYPPKARRAAEKLAKIAPPQKIGPVQFGIEQGILTIDFQPIRSRSEDRVIAMQALEALIENGEHLLDGLNSSNCDQRLITWIERIQSQAASRKNIIQLGVANTALEVFVERSHDELPALLTAQLIGYSLSIKQYTQQFPDWNRYVENAFVAEASEDDFKNAKALGNALLAKLKAAGDLVDPEVPKSLKIILEALNDPSKSGKRLLFAFIRTVENLFAKVCSFCAGVIAAVNTGIKRAVSASAFILIMVCIAEFTPGISSAVAKSLGASWMKTAAEIVESELSKTG